MTAYTLAPYAPWPTSLPPAWHVARMECAECGTAVINVWPCGQALPCARCQSEQWVLLALPHDALHVDDDDDVREPDDDACAGDDELPIDDEDDDARDEDDDARDEDDAA